MKMPELAIWYHAKTHGSEFGIDDQFSLNLVNEQMANLAISLLAHHSASIHYGFNDSPERVAHIKPVLLTVIPGTETTILCHGESSRSELSTLHALQNWLPGHPEALVCYFHAKGVTHPHDRFNRQWRLCQEYPVINGWRRCVQDLQNGAEAVGAHWLTPEKYPGTVKSPFFGGNYFWATAKFLLTLPEIPATSTSRDQDFLAENWIGLGPRRPRIKDYRPHWPGKNTCVNPTRCYLIHP